MFQNQNNARRQLSELMKLRLETRNKVRALLSAEEEEAVAILNLVRRRYTPREVFQVEKVLRDDPRGRGSLVPELFPQQPQTQDLYHRTETLPAIKQISVIAIAALDVRDRLDAFYRDLRELNNKIVNRVAV